MNAIEIKNLTKSFKDFKIDNLNLTLPSGCIMGLVGENGAGKSTTIRLILDIIARDGGEITVLGNDNKKDFHITKQDIGIVLDNTGFYESFRATDVSRIMKRAYTNWSDKVFFDYLKRFSVPAKKKYKELSKGMKMKLNIAIALSHDAKLLILDEPTSGLDPVIRDEIVDIFGEFTRDENRSVLISSHITSDLEKICDYFAFMKNGKIVLCEEKDRLLEKYCILQCSEEDLESIDETAVLYKKSSPYGVTALCDREMLPNGLTAGAADIEEIFVLMMKEGARVEEPIA